MSKRWRRRRRKQVRKHEDLLVKEKLSEIKDTTQKHDWKKAIKISQNYICPICGKPGTDSSMDVHHKKPRARHGGNNRENLVSWHKSPCHREYHRKYGLRTSDDYGNPIE